MDKIIDRLSDIEKAAGSLMDDAGVRKKALAKEMEEKTAAFDRELAISICRSPFTPATPTRKFSTLYIR